MSVTPPPSPSAFAVSEAGPSGVVALGGTSANFSVLPASQVFGSADSSGTPSFSFAPYVSAQLPQPCNANVAKGIPIHAHVVTPLRVSQPKPDSETVVESRIILPPAPSHPSLLTISEISESVCRFSFEGKILNKYGTYKLPSVNKAGEVSKVHKYLKCDLADSNACNTITLSIGDDYIALYESKIVVGSFIRIEGPVVKPKNRNDGGTSSVSLHVDATTSILKGEAFECDLSFHPEIRIRQFLEHASLSTSQDRKLPLATVAFVVINVPDTSQIGKSSADHLTIADGASPHDRATVSVIALVLCL